MLVRPLQQQDMQETHRVALGGMIGGWPAAPYAEAGGHCSSRSSPTAHAERGSGFVRVRKRSLRVAGTIKWQA